MPCIWVCNLVSFRFDSQRSFFLSLHLKVYSFCLPLLANATQNATVQSDNCRKKLVCDKAHSKFLYTHTHTQDFMLYAQSFESSRWYKWRASTVQALFTNKLKYGAYLMRSFIRPSSWKFTSSLWQFFECPLQFEIIKYREILRSSRWQLLVLSIKATADFRSISRVQFSDGFWW